MASTKEYLDFIMGQLSNLEEITYRAMMKEYILYYRRKIVGGIYDDRLLVKPVEFAIHYMSKVQYELPYDGAKEMLLVEEVDNRKFLEGLFQVMYDEIAQSIAVIFFFNVLAAIFFPILGKALGFDTMHGDAFGIFAGTAINDTSSVTAAASTWDSMWGLGSATLNKAVTVKLTRTLAIIPITLGLSFIRAKKERQASNFSLKRAFPMFILYFILAAIFTTVCVNVGVDSSVFAPLKELSKFLIIMAMAAIGLNSNVIQLIKTGGKPIAVGATCWCGITIVSLVMQHVMHIW